MFPPTTVEMFGMKQPVMCGGPLYSVHSLTWNDRGRQIKRRKRPHDVVDWCGCLFPDDDEIAYFSVRWKTRSL